MNIININPLIKSEDVAPIEFNNLIEDKSKFDELPVEIIFLDYKGSVKREYNVIKIDYIIACDYKAECDRCLRETFNNIVIDGEKVLTQTDDEDNGYEFDSYTVTDGLLDLDEFLLELLSLELPTKILCKKECKGLCLQCGADLNENPCDCVVKYKNPAFAILDNLNIENNGEV